MARETASRRFAIGDLTSLALSMDGVNDAISFLAAGDNGFLNAYASGAFECWAYRNSNTAIPSATTEQVGIYFDDVTANQHTSIQFGVVSGQVYMRIGSNAGAFVRANTPIPRGQWNHFVWSSNGTTWKFWMNGVEMGLTILAGTNNGNWFSDTGGAGTKHLQIGLYRSIVTDTANSGVYGRLGRVRIFATQPTTEQVQDLYYEGKTYETPLFDLPLTEGSGLTVTDTIAARVGTLVNGPAWLTSGPFAARNLPASARNAAAARTAA